MVAVSPSQLTWLACGLWAPTEWRVLWSLKEELQSHIAGDLSDGYYISSWLPQAEILAHPRCVAAVLHCGWGSACEAITSGTPVCEVPFFSDQFGNAEKLREMGMGIVVSAPQADDFGTAERDA